MKFWGKNLLAELIKWVPWALLWSQLRPQLEPDYSNGDIVIGEKRMPQGITISLGPAKLWVVWWPGGSCSLRRGQVLVFINRHNPTMNLVEEKQRRFIIPGLQRWPLQLIEHLANTSNAAPPPAGPVGCRPLYLLHLLNLSFTIWAPNRCCILQFISYQSFACNLISTPRCESQDSSCEGNLKS